MQVNGSVAGTSAYINTSDARLKKDVSPIEDGLAVVSKLKGIRFHWRKPAERTIGKMMNLPTTEPQIGFLAQDVKAVLPEAVVQGSDGVMSMEETKIIPVLVEAVKELKAENDEIRAELKMLTDHASQAPTAAP